MWPRTSNSPVTTPFALSHRGRFPRKRPVEFSRSTETNFLRRTPAAARTGSRGGATQQTPTALVGENSLQSSAHVVYDSAAISPSPPRRRPRQISPPPGAAAAQVLAFVPMWACQHLSSSLSRGWECISEIFSSTPASMGTDIGADPSGMALGCEGRRRFRLPVPHSSTDRLGRDKSWFALLVTRLPDILLTPMFSL